MQANDSGAEPWIAGDAGLCRPALGCCDPGIVGEGQPIRRETASFAGLVIKYYQKVEIRTELVSHIA
jgi:hypothetical protein